MVPRFDGWIEGPLNPIGTVMVLAVYLCSEHVGIVPEIPITPGGPYI